MAELFLSRGLYRGGYRYLPHGGINWYFSNLGLWFFAEHIPDIVRDYMDLYIRCKDPVLQTISDVCEDLTTLRAPDSHDAYGATFISLAVRYYHVTADHLWWHTNVAHIKAVAYANLLRQIKPNGLIRVLQAPHPNGIGYLMDQCEAYAALRDLSSVLLKTDDPDASYYGSFVLNLGTAIHTQLYDGRKALWRWSDETPATLTCWYPDAVSQIVPHLYNVHGRNIAGDYERFTTGYENFNRAAPLWWQRPNDTFPWLMVAFYAALRWRDVAHASAMLVTTTESYLPGLVNAGYYPLSDLGFALGTTGLVSSLW